MNKKFNYALVISLICAFIYGFITFLSLNFFWNGNIMKSVFVAISIICVLELIVFVLKLLKSASHDFIKNAYYEISILIIFLLFSIVLSVTYSHYFTVRDRKQNISNKILTDIDKSKKMFDAYETYANNRIRTYNEQLETAISGKVSNKAFFLETGFRDNGESYSIQRNRMIRVFSDDLMPAQYDSLKVHAFKWLDDAEVSLTKWKPIGLMSVISSIEKEVIQWRSQLQNYSLSTKKAETDPFQYQISFSSVEQELTKQQIPTLFSIITALLLYCLILLPYLATSRIQKSRTLFDLIRKKEPPKILDDPSIPISFDRNKTS